MKSRPTHPDSFDVRELFKPRPLRDPLLLAILGMAIILSALIFMMYLSWGSGQALGDTPWYIPVTHSFAALAALSVAFLAFGRYPVLRDAASYWIGMGFAAFAVQSGFFILAWPGLLPGGQAIIARLPSTSGWIAMFELASLSISLLFAVLSRWPGWSSDHLTGNKPLSGRRWLWSAAAWIGLVILTCLLIVIFEQRLPVLVGPQGNLTRLILTLDWGYLLLFSVGAILSARRYQQTGDSLLGYVSLTQLALAFVVLTAIIGAKRYDIWYYLSRIIIVGGFLSLMFGLLSEYVRLFRREREGRLMLEAILENIPIGLAVTGGPPAFPLIHVSRQGLGMSQRPVEELVGRPTGQHQSAWRIFLPDGMTQPLPEQMPLYRASRFGEGTRNQEFVMEALDGRKIPVLVNAAPIRDATGQIVAAINTWLDITDRKRAEEELRRSEEKFSVAFHGSIAGTSISRLRDGLVIDANDPWLALFGYRRDEVIGKVIAQQAWKYPEERKQMVHDLEQNGALHNREVHFRRIDGEDWVGLTSVRVSELNGEAVIISSVVDITDRLQAEQALKESETRFRLAVEGVADEMWFADAEGRMGMINLSPNTAMGLDEFSQKTVDEVLEEVEILNPDGRLRPPGDAPLLRSLRGETVQGEEIMHNRRSGRLRYRMFNSAPQRDEAERIIGAVAIVRDITEQKQAELALRKHATELERANRDLRNFAVVAAHDLQEPLRKIEAFGEAVMEGTSNLDHRQVDRIARMQTSARQMREMVNGLQQLAFLATENKPFQPVDLHQVVLEIGGLLDRKIRQTGGVVEIGKLPVIEADPNQMRMLFLHLIENALKFQPTGARPQVKIYSSENEPGRVQIQVEDNGIGFDSAHAAHLFEPFERLVGKNQSEYGGIGMGLAVCRWIVERHGGEIAASSQPGRGSTFSVRLPVRQMIHIMSLTREGMIHG